jgi:hypothetical protein
MQKRHKSFGDASAPAMTAPLASAMPHSTMCSGAFTLNPIDTGHTHIFENYAIDVGIFLKYLHHGFFGGSLAVAVGRAYLHVFD